MARDSKGKTKKSKAKEPDKTGGTRYFIDAKLAESNSRSLPLLVGSRRCYVCQQADEDSHSSTPSIDFLLDCIRDHCMDTIDYLPPDTPLKEAIFRVILSGKNKPIGPEQISTVLSDKWSATAFPRNVSVEVIKRLIDNSESYSITPMKESRKTKQRSRKN